MEVTLKNITKVYEGGESASPAVDDVSLRVDSGEMFFLLGPSGCGKTTLLRMIAGLLEPTDGVIEFGQRDVTNLPAERRNTAMVFQSYALWPHMTVQQNVEFGPKMRRVARSRRREIVGEQLIRVQMDDYARRKPNQLSGGQQQRVALARALAADADLLLLDEPLSNLDAQLRLHMRGELGRLVKASGTTAIYVTHDQKEALSMADRIAVMNDGQIVQLGRPEELYNRPATRFVADFLGEANFIDGKVASIGPPVEIDTPIGRILARSPDQLAPGDNVTCCIRPEWISIAPAGQTDTRQGQPLLPAVVAASVYLGEIRQYLCTLGEAGDVRWKVSSLAGSAEGLADRDKAMLLISTDDVAVLRR